MGPNQMGVETVPDGCELIVYHMTLATQSPPRMTFPMTPNSPESTSSLPELMVMQAG